MLMSIPKVYEDEAYVVFEKPAHLLVIPAPEAQAATMVSVVNGELPADAGYRLHPCHRLDRETSGLIIFAKGKKYQQLMMEEFKGRKILKTYVAFVRGQMHPAKGEIRSFIKGQAAQRFSSRSRPEYAMTRYQVKEVRKDFSIVEVYPLTGRTNQIRIQFLQKGHPLLGDYKYAWRRDFTVKFKRVALHACGLEFVHPLTKKNVKLHSPLPKDMEDFIRDHRN